MIMINLSVLVSKANATVPLVACRARVGRFIIADSALWHRLIVLLVAVLLLISSSSFAGNNMAGDPRQFMHGIGAVQADNHDMYVFFSSSGTPPQPARKGAGWTHDIYLVRWDAENGALGPVKIFIQKPEAQEPVSVAQNAHGTVMLMVEDGWRTNSEVTQHYGVYDSALRPVRSYPQIVEPGGHSGHVAAVGDYFVATYSDGWVDAGGVDNLGSGNGVYAKIYDGRGNLLHNVNVVHERRAWWPVVAGGTTGALLVWQEYVQGRQTANLNAALIDPVSGQLRAQRLLHDRVRYYTYNVAWLGDIERFLVLGTASGHGFAKLIDSRGKVTATLSCMPATVREAGIAVQRSIDFDKANLAYTPSSDGRLLQLRAQADSLVLSGILSATRGGPVPWQPLGSIGLFRTSGALDWLSLTPQGIEQIQFEPAQSARPAKRDLCH